MGIVYKAYDPAIDRTVAIKTVDHTALTRQEVEDFEQRFNREAKSAGRLNHPNIVTIHDVGRSEDLSYIAMEFLVGQSLRDILDSGHELSLLRIAEIAAQIADGLAFAHANDVVHRDIKPANIMVLDHDVVKITDFGVALLPSGAHTLDGVTCGSPKYMSPEQITGQKADGRSDIFSLGAVLYEMLSGCPPFTGDDLSAILYQVLNNAPPLPSTYYPSLPHGFDRIVARAMAKSPDKRYQNAGEMSADLRKYRRFAKHEQKKEHSENTVSSPEKTSAAEKIDGNATLPIGTAAINPLLAKATNWTRQYGLRVGLPLLAALVLAGALLLRPDADTSVPPAVVAETSSADAMPPVATPKVSPDAPMPVVNANPTPDIPTPVLNNEPTETIAAAPTEPPVVVPVPPPVAPVVAAPVVSEARVKLAIAPWGEIYVDNRKVGISPPLGEIKVSPGKHKIEIRNNTFAPYQQNIELAANASLRIKHKFE